MTKIGPGNVHYVLVFHKNNLVTNIYPNDAAMVLVFLEQLNAGCFLSHITKRGIASRS